MDLRFEWDRRKAVANERAHGVSFEEAMDVFRDPLARIHADPGSSVSEVREIIVGPRWLVAFYSSRSLNAASASGSSARVPRPSTRNETMKKAGSRTRPVTSGKLLPEYRFDYSKSSSNRFAARLQGNVVAVVLEPDVSEVFPTSAAVNQALRVLAKAAQKRVRVAKRASTSKARRR